MFNQSLDNQSTVVSYKTYYSHHLIIIIYIIVSKASALHTVKWPNASSSVVYETS